MLAKEVSLRGLIKSWAIGGGYEASVWNHGRSVPLFVRRQWSGRGNAGGECKTAVLDRRVVVEDPEHFAGARVVYRIVLDVRLGGNIELQKLKVPPKVEVGIANEKGKQDADIREFLSARADLIE